MAEKINTSNVQKIRKQNKLTQEELAQNIGVTRQTIIAIEKGNYMPSVLLALKIAHFFKKPVDYLFEYTTHAQQ
ncbi:MAG: helix-turn-helix transcriptional regulator [Candidatus Roizmanbacteria bacterium]|nr:helix-turn-helix transcriptional regulator [Candidatus Roizmanbacteria bacterium]